MSSDPRILRFGVITLRLVLIIYVTQSLGMLFVRWRKGLHAIPNFPAVVVVHEGLRPVQVFEVDEVFLGTVCCHSKPSLYKQASMAQLVRIEFRDGLTHPVRWQDPTVGGRQLLVGVPLSPLSPSSYHASRAFPTPNQLEQPPVSCIDRLHLFRAPCGGGIPSQSVASLLVLS